MSRPRVEYSVRPCEETDHEALVAVYASTRASEIAHLPWTAEQADAFVRSQFELQERDWSGRRPRAECSVLIVGGRVVGRLVIDRDGVDLHVVDIALLDETRGLGIGSAIIRELAEEADRDGRGITLFVEEGSRAARFYARLGFVEIDCVGVHRHLRRAPTT